MRVFDDKVDIVLEKFEFKINFYNTVVDKVIDSIDDYSVDNGAGIADISVDVIVIDMVDSVANIVFVDIVFQDIELDYLIASEFETYLRFNLMFD